MRFAVVGTNFISDNFADAVSKVDAASITAVYSRAKETGENFSNRHSVKNVFTDYREMLSSKLFDAVYVASPTLLHTEHSTLALESGYNVLCEKMLAPTLSDFYIMKQTAKRTDKVLLEAMRPVFDPAYEILKNELSKIGRIRRASLEFCQYSSRFDRFKMGILTNAFDPKMKNSALSDIGIYPLTVALDLFGCPEDIKASSVFLENGFEGEGVSTLIYSDKLVSVVYSKITDGIRPSVIEGEDGSILIDKLTAPRSIKKRMRCGEEMEIPIPFAENNMVYEIESFIKMTEGKLSSLPYLKLSENAAVAVDKIYKITGTDSRF